MRKNLNEELNRIKNIFSKVDKEFVLNEGVIKEGVGGLFDDLISKIATRTVANRIFAPNLVQELESAGFTGVRNLLDLAKKAEQIYMSSSETFNIRQMMALTKVPELKEGVFESFRGSFPNVVKNLTSPDPNKVNAAKNYLQQNGFDPAFADELALKFKGRTQQPVTPTRSTGNPVVDRTPSTKTVTQDKMEGAFVRFKDTIGKQLPDTYRRGMYSDWKRFSTMTSDEILAELLESESKLSALRTKITADKFARKRQLFDEVKNYLGSVPSTKKIIVTSVGIVGVIIALKYVIEILFISNDPVEQAAAEKTFDMASNAATGIIKGVKRAVKGQQTTVNEVMKLFPCLNDKAILSTTTPNVFKLVYDDGDKFDVQFQNGKLLFMNNGEITNREFTCQQ